MNQRSARFSPAARQCYPLAHQAAVGRRHPGVGLEHLLEALTAQADTQAVRLLVAAGVELAVLRRHLVADLEAVSAGWGASMPSGFVLQVPQLRRAFEQAVAEAGGGDSPYVETGHLLLGLLAEEESRPARTLALLGVTRARVLVAWPRVAGDPTERQQARRVLEQSCRNLEQRAGVCVLPEALDAIMARAEAVGPAGVQSRAQGLLDRLGRAAQEAATPRLPKDLRDLRAAIDRLTQQKEAAVLDQDFERAAELRHGADRLKKELAARLRGRNERGDPALVVLDAAAVAALG